MPARVAALVATVGLTMGLLSASASADTVMLSVTASIGSDGTTILVAAPGCQPTPPGTFDITVQTRSASGEVGEGAVAVGSFFAPDQGSVLIPNGTPVTSFLLTVACNGGALTGSLPFVLTTPAPPVVAPPRFTG